MISNGWTVGSSRNWSHVAPKASTSSRESASWAAIGNGPLHELVLLVRRVLGDERAELRGEHGEDLADLGGPHARLVVLEQDVVRVVVRREALDVLPAEVDDALEPRPERREVGRPRAPSPRPRTTRPPPSRTRPRARRARAAPRSQSRCATRISEASSESCGSDAAYGSSSSKSSPKRSSTHVRVDDLLERRELGRAGRRRRPAA